MSDDKPTRDAPAAAPTAYPDEPPAVSGRHSTVRPEPVPPPPAPPRTSTRPAPAVALGHTSVDTSVDTAVEPPVVPTPVAAPAPEQAPLVEEPEPAVVHEYATEPDEARDELFPEPNAPLTTSKGTHVLGVVVGLVLAPLAIVVLLLGQARILDAQAAGWDATLDVTGIVLVVVGLVTLAWVLVLALWTPAAPITGGGLLTLAGGLALIAPGLTRTQVLRAIDSQGWHLTITQVTVAGTSGTLLVAGTLLLLAGIVAAVARRRGVRLGEFRERHR